MFTDVDLIGEHLTRGSLTVSSYSVADVFFQGHMKTKLQISTLLPKSTIRAPVTHVHEYMSQEDIGDLRSVFPSPSCSLFRFFGVTTSL